MEFLLLFKVLFLYKDSCIFVSWQHNLIFLILGNMIFSSLRRSASRAQPCQSVGERGTSCLWQELNKKCRRPVPHHHPGLTPCTSFFFMPTCSLSTSTFLPATYFSIFSSRSSTLSRPAPPTTLNISRTSSRRSREEERQEWDAKLLGKPGRKRQKPFSIEFS